jgi:hypothetical protein
MISFIVMGIGTLFAKRTRTVFKMKPMVLFVKQNYVFGIAIEMI